MDVKGAMNAALMASGSVNSALSHEIGLKNALGDQYEYYNELRRNTDSANAFNAEQAQINRDWQEKMTAQALEFNQNEAAKNRDWQQMMSNTAHQREIVDLKAAGLNPVLSAMNGNGASVGSGATASAVGVGSGGSANADTSKNAALVNILGTMLNTQMQLEAANINARTQEAVADKYTAMSYITGQMAAAATTQAAGMNAAAARYGYDTQKAIAQMNIDNPNNMVGVVREILKGSTGSGSISGFTKSLGEAFKAAPSLKELHLSRDQLRALGVPVA